MALYLENDGIPKDLVIQFGESECPKGNFIYFADEVWKQIKPIDAHWTGVIEFPFRNFGWANNFSPRGNGRIDLDSIAYFGLYLNAPTGASGTVFFGRLYLTP